MAFAASCLGGPRAQRAELLLHRREAFAQFGRVLACRRGGELGSQQLGLLPQLPVLPVQLDEDRDLGAQHPRVERLGDVVDGAGRVPAEGVLGPAVDRGQEDDRDVAGPLRGA